MLMGYAKVSAQGDYTPPPALYAKAAYATLIKTRADIVRDAGWALARAATIAVNCMFSLICLHAMPCTLACLAHTM